MKDGLKICEIYIKKELVFLLGVLDGLEFNLSGGL